VTGAGGMLGRAATELYRDMGDETFCYDHGSLDIADGENVDLVFEEIRPDAVVNCAAWTDVDGCEFDPARATAANALGPENLAKASQRVGSAFVTVSTDYVFDGRKDDFYTQRDDPNPINVYGVSKLEGERRAQSAYARTIVVRSGFIFGPGGKNFLSTIAERARRGERIKAINDSFGTPTYVFDLAARLRKLAARDLPGIYHVVNSGEGASYEDVAKLALKCAGLGDQLETVSTDSLARPAPRPRNSRLKCLLSEAIGLSSLPTWQDAFRKFAALTRER
jgi:dTDP-4-dehydrorhamnose reductase